MQGSVKPYGKHLAVCTGLRSWPPKVDKDPQQFAHALRAALDRHASHLPYNVREQGRFVWLTLLGWLRRQPHGARWPAGWPR